MDQQNTLLEACGKQSKTTCREEKNSEKGRFNYLQGGMGGETGSILQEHLGTEYETTSIFKFSAFLASVSEDLGKLGNDLHKGDHITVVGE
jgi:hypothetical protein